MKAGVLAVSFLALATAASAQVFSHPCDSAVFVNPSSLLPSGAHADIINAENSIITKGADPVVIIDDTVSDLTPEQYVATLQKACTSWQSADGGVKNNLIVFLVFPKRHKVGLFMGKEFEKAINASTVRTQYMAPAFRDGDWERGMISGINQVGVEIEAYQTAALHPATTTNVVNQQATDMSGLWKWLDWVLGSLLVLAFLFGAWGLFVYYRRRRSDRLAAQQNAVHWRNEAAQKVTGTSYTSFSEEFARLSNSETFNPDTNDLDADEYSNMAARYKMLCDNIDKRAEWDAPQAKTQTKVKGKHYTMGVDTASAAPEARTDIPAGNPASVQNTTIINEDRSSNPGYDPLYVPVVIDEPVVEREPVREEPSSGWSGSSSSSDTDDSSSSFSDSSSSSDFSDSGSSFSDSSSSSDFGGGGGGFGGGSDSF